MEKSMTPHNFKKAGKTDKHINVCISPEMRHDAVKSHFAKVYIFDNSYYKSPKQYDNQNK